MILPSEKATEIVKDRQGKYGHPADVYQVWASLITPVLGFRPTLQQCATMLLLLKVAREVNAGWPVDYSDNVDDMAGYANVLAMVKERLA